MKIFTMQEAQLTEHLAYTPPEEASSIERVPFGIWHLDVAFPRGIKPWAPQIYGMQGGPGARKTSLVLNILCNEHLSGAMPKDFSTAVDSLETGMTVERYCLAMKCMLATRIMIYEQWTGPQSADTLWQLVNRNLPQETPEQLLAGVKRDGANYTDCMLYPDFIESCYANQSGYTFSARQLDAWERAGEEIATWPIMVFGVSEHYDDKERAERYTETTNIENSFERWLKLAEEYNVRQLIVDFLQNYFTESGNLYEKQLTVVPYMAEWCRRSSGTLWAISQESITNVRDARGRYGEPLGAAGGNILLAESQTNLRLEYLKRSNPHWLTLRSPMKGRRGHYPDLGLMIDPVSGAIFGRSFELARVKGMVNNS